MWFTFMDVDRLSVIPDACGSDAAWILSLFFSCLPAFSYAPEGLRFCGL